MTCNMNIMQCKGCACDCLFLVCFHADIPKCLKTTLYNINVSPRQLIHSNIFHIPFEINWFARLRGGMNI